VGTSVLADGCVHLSLATFAGLFVVPMFAKIGENACLLTLFLEAFQRTLEVLIVMDDDFRQTQPPEEYLMG
jgi:hypothetical protein